jgi:phosphatidylserine/phosphatidylglycerophosphate/cardiolipin synthase-like enzyme
VELTDWLLAPGERGNPSTRLDRRRPGGVSWSTGNKVRPLVHGAVYFAELLAAIRGQKAGDLLLFTDWRGDPDEPLDGPGSEIGTVLCEAAERGVIVKGLVWRSGHPALPARRRPGRPPSFPAPRQVLLSPRGRPPMVTSRRGGCVTRR